MDYLPHTVLIDCTASAAVAARYADWLAAGIHIVTPNKKANSADLADYRRLQQARRAGGSHYLYEATVGAGLPVVQTLRDLRETGDDITSIEGIFSGTLAYLFNVYDGSAAFSAIVHDARQRGYTEPDPRDDLSGMDVARKLIILGPRDGAGAGDEGRQGGEPGADASSPRGSHRGVHGAAAALRRAMQQRLAGARDARQGAALHRQDHCRRARPPWVCRSSTRATPFANIALTDNVVRFATRRYCDNPLIVQGPGAGPEVTAGGVFADLLRLAAYLGARL